MTQCPYLLFEFYNNLGQKINIPNDLIFSAIWSRKINGIGTAIIQIPSDCTSYDFAAVSQEDLGMSISIAFNEGQAPVPDLETFWFLRRFKETIVDRKSSYTLTFKDSMHLLDRRIVAYRADDPQGSQPETRIQEPGNIALKRIFDTNLGNAAGFRDLSPYVSSASIAAPSLTINKEIPWKNVLRTMQQIVRTSRDKGQDLFFDLVALPTSTDVRFEFRTYLGQRGQDKTPDTIFTSHPLFKLVTFEIDYDTPNVAYVGGIGRGRERQVERGANPRALQGRFTRFEDFKSVRSGVEAVLIDMARNIVNNVAGIIRLEGQLLGDLASDFGFGDRLTVSHKNLEVICEVTNIASNFTNQEYTRTVVIKSV